MSRATDRPRVYGRNQGLYAHVWQCTTRPAARQFLSPAGIAATASQRDTLEHLARYVARPPVATERLALTGSGYC